MACSFSLSPISHHIAPLPRHTPSQDFLQTVPCLPVRILPVPSLLDLNIFLNPVMTVNMNSEVVLSHTQTWAAGKIIRTLFPAVLESVPPEQGLGLEPGSLSCVLALLDRALPPGYGLGHLMTPPKPCASLVRGAD